MFTMPAYGTNSGHVFVSRNVGRGMSRGMSRRVLVGPSVISGEGLGSLEGFSFKPIKFLKNLAPKFLRKPFENVLTGAIRIASAGLYDPTKNRFFVPFSSGHVRTLGKGLTSVVTMGTVNSEKFFDSSSMRVAGTVVGAAGAAITGGLVAPSVMGALGPIGTAVKTGFTTVTGALPSLSSVGTGLSIFSQGMGLMKGFSGGGQQAYQEMPQEIPQDVPQEIIQTGYPTVYNPMMNTPYSVPNMPLPYSMNVSPSIQPSVVEVIKSKPVPQYGYVQSTLPGGVEISTVTYKSPAAESVVQEIGGIDAFGSPVYY